MKRFTLSVCAAVLVVSGCSSQNEDRARENVRKTGVKLEQDAKQLSHNVEKAVGPDGRSASQKLTDGEAKLAAAGDKASLKLTQAALIAQVKANLASEAGLSSITAIDVSASGSVVTLTGHVSTQAQKDSADHAASKVDGVTRVANEISVDR